MPKVCSTIEGAIDHDKKEYAHGLESLIQNKYTAGILHFLPTNTKGKFYYLYLFVDIYSRFIVGWYIDKVQDNKVSAAVLQQICDDKKIEASQPALYSDNGSAMKGVTMLATNNATAGLIRLFSRPATSNDNPYFEALFKTVKYIALPILENHLKVYQKIKKWIEKFTK